MPEPPALHRKTQAEIVLSDAALLVLITAVHERGADFRFRAPGTSMYPTIRDGDIITLSPLNGVKLECGDIIAFRHPDTGKLVVHRIITVHPDRFEAKGDNAVDSDGLTPVSSVVGLITRVERDGVPIVWPDVRRFPRGARIYFRTQNCFQNLKKRICSLYKKERHVQRWLQ